MTAGSRPRRHLGVALGTLLGVALGPADVGHAQSGKPRVPPGRDPGGVAVAIIGSGADYTTPAIAQRLARDGEGEIVGWDFVDGDRRPLGGCGARRAPASRCSTDIAAAVLDEATSARLVIVRADGEEPQTVVQAVWMIAAGPARIVLMLKDAGARHPEFAQQAARRFPDLLIIASRPAVSTARADVAAAPNLVTVEPANRDAASGRLAPAADVAVPALPPAQGDRTMDQAADLAADLAAARVAALAARLSAVEPGLDAAGLKRRIVSLATLQPVETGAIPRPGLIDRPELLFKRD